MGWKYGFFVAFVDVLKGIFAILIAKWIFPDSPDLTYLSGIMEIIGHIFPLYLKFRGGKGVATLVEMMFGLNWKLGIFFVLLVFIPALIAVYIVVGSFIKSKQVYLPTITKQNAVYAISNYLDIRLASHITETILGIIPRSGSYQDRKYH